MGDGWKGIAAGLAAGLVVGVALLVFRGGLPAWPHGAAPEDAAVDTASVAGADTADGDSAVHASRDNAIVHATERAAPAVVSIYVRQQQAVNTQAYDFMERMGLAPHREYRDVRSMGSGVIVSADGLIVTNSHVVEAAVDIIVLLSDGRQFQAVPVDNVERYDLAVLRIEGRDLPVARLGDSDDLRTGEWAIAIGSPFGYLLADAQPTVTVGVISAVNRDIRMSGGDRVYLGMIQTDAAINPGNSGGPLVNTDGEVVGINTFIFSESGGSVGIGFAVPVARVRTVLEEIARYGHYRDISLGFTLRQMSPLEMARRGLEDPAGLMVDAVETGRPAWQAGLRAGDVLRELGGVKVASLSTVWRVVYDRNVGDHLPFIAERNGSRWQGELVIEELKQP
ncbi:MAG TPA: trypsin-like peptidase domain-containing protein [Candidatus Krumholzibacteria bacterium]|nr:trypsin-like peptidase domain-containing protein [Candidatus Krumholzibacteria bacterium]